MNFFNKKKKIILNQKEILSHPLNMWTRENKIIWRFFSHVISKIEEEDYKILTLQKNIAFLKCEGNLSATLPSHSEINFILIFPNLMTEISKANNSLAFAIIFHEFGHIYHNHINSNADEITKQIQADSFAVKYGYAFDLLDFLDGFNTHEARLRREFILKSLN